MANFSIYDSANFRVLIPEVIHLESEHFELAKQICLQATNEEQEWNNYLTSLALVAFKDWLNEKIPQRHLDLDIDIRVFDNRYYLSLADIKYCLIAIEDVLDEVVDISKNIIEKSTMLVDFYVLLEVLDEEEEVIIKGFLSHEDLTNYCCEVTEGLFYDDCYQIPLSLFDLEPNHLLLSHQLADLAKLSPTVNLVHTEEEIFVDGLERRIPKLSQWFKNIFDEGWLTIDKLTKTEATLALTTRKTVEGVRRGKLIDLEIQLGKNTVALLVNIVKVNGKKYSVLVQLHPTGKRKVLPHRIRLIMFSKAGKIIQEVESRIQDNYIQLKPFRGEAGKRFSVEVAFEDVSVRESFEI